MKEDAGNVSFFWSPSGQELYVNLRALDPEVRHFHIDVMTGKVTRLNMLKHYLRADQTRDGKLFLVSFGT